MKRRKKRKKKTKIPSPSLSKRLKASLNSAICSSVSCSAMLPPSFFLPLSSSLFPLLLLKPNTNGEKKFVSLVQLAVTGPHQLCP